MDRDARQLFRSTRYLQVENAGALDAVVSDRSHGDDYEYDDEQIDKPYHFAT